MSLQKSLSKINQHPVLKKWLYLPAANKNFEKIAQKIVELIAKGDPRIGIFPKIKKPKKISKRTL